MTGHGTGELVLSCADLCWPGDGGGPVAPRTSAGRPDPGTGPGRRPPVSLDLRRGGVVTVTGGAGAGKTLLVHTLAGIEHPASGTIRWDLPHAVLWRDLALVPQSLALVDELDVADNIALPSLVQRRRPPPDLDRLLDELDLRWLRARRVGEISVGERQRTMVARALATTAPVVLADEPTAHQDLDHATAILDLLRRRADGGGACVVATRDPAVAAATGSDVTLDLS